MGKLVIAVTLLVAASFGYTLFTENFDAAWSTNNPPTGWRIFHTTPGDSGRDDWHREPANTAPWSEHPTPFAAIGPTLSPDAPPDSLISPAINCAGYGNITLMCSTYFYRWSSQPYVARLVYSTDGGATWPYTLHDYYVDSSPPGPKLESLQLEQAAGQANVQLAWVYDGDLNYIQWWSVDDISVVGELTGVVETDLSPAPRAPGLSLSCEPNPFRSSTVLHLTPGPLDRSTTHFCVYDSQGRAVRSFSSLLPPPSSLTWDGRSDFGQPLPSGTYFIRCDVAGEHVTTRLVLQR